MANIISVAGLIIWLCCHPLLAVAEPRHLVEEISFVVGELEVKATLFLPKSTSPHPIVLTLHGMGGNRFGPRGLFARAGKFWAENGIASLTVSTGGKGGSEGDFRDMTLHRRLAEAIEAVRWISGRSDLDDGQLFVLGHSQGGLIATALAKSLSKSNPVNGVVLWAPNENATKTYRRAMGQSKFQEGLNAGPGKIIRWKNSLGAVREFRSGFFESLKDFDPVDDLASVESSLLVVIGKTDRWSTRYGAEKMLAAHKGSHHLLVINTGHRMGAQLVGSQSEVAYRQTLQWISRQLR